MSAGVVAALLALTAATAAVAWLPFALAAAVHLAATACWMRLVGRIVRGSWRPAFGAALLATVLLRAVCLPQPVVLSDDVWRYLHEGRLVLAGENPYLVAPAEAPVEWRGPHWERINHPEVPAAYPPAMQLALAAGAAVSDAPLGMKLVFTTLDVLAFVALWLLLPAWGVPRERALVYGLCPLAAVEIAGQAHGESLVVLTTVLAVGCAARGRGIAAGGTLAVAAAGKLLPAALLPFVARRAGAGRSVAAFAVVLALLYLPFVAAPAELLRGTLEYAARWRSNDSSFALLHAVAEAVVSAGWTEGAGLWLREPQRLAKVLLALLGLGVLALCWRRRLPPERVALIWLLFFVAATPTLHPWYVVLLVPWLALRPQPLLLAFTGTVFLAYHVLPRWQSEGVWREVGAVKVVEYLPFYAGLLVLAAGRARRGG